MTSTKTCAQAVDTGSNSSQITAGAEQLTRKHGVRCLLSGAHGIDSYKKAAADVMGSSAIVAASKIYGKAIIFACTITIVHKLVQRGIIVGGG